jgi:hypothetical protein
MDIKKADSKGRLTVGEEGVVYSVHRNDDDSMMLIPLSIPTPPILEAGDMRAVYVNPSTGPIRPSVVTIYSAFPNSAELARFVAETCEWLMIPAVVNVLGVGGGIADMLEARLGTTLVRKYN